MSLDSSDRPGCYCFFFFNDTATTEIYTLSLHDALPIFLAVRYALRARAGQEQHQPARRSPDDRLQRFRSEEHTSELQSRLHLVCRLLLEKKKEIPAMRDPDQLGCKIRNVQYQLPADFGA